jgi:hypothetical protein
MVVGLVASFLSTTWGLLVIVGAIVYFVWDEKHFARHGHKPASASDNADER